MPDYCKVYKKPPTDKIQIAWGNYIAGQKWSMLKKYISIKNPHILEIGFGNGVFMEQCPYPDIYGIDTDASSIARMKSKGFNVRKESFDKMSFPDETFDLIYLSHVLEHTLYPEQAINEIHRVLKKGGILCIVTPDIKRHKFNFYTDHTHKSPFTKDSITNLLALYDCKVLHIRHGLFHQFYWDYFLKRFRPLRKFVYVIKELIGQILSTEMIVVAKKQ